MRFQRSVATWAGVVLVMAAADVQAQNGRGSTPHGRPFQQLQSQFEQVNEELAALDARVQAVEARVLSVEGGLQAQIDLLNANLGALQTQITTVQSAVASLEATVAANTTAIGMLQAAISDLQAALEEANAAIAANTGDVQTLNGQVAGITTLIAAHTSQIASLQQQNTFISQFLTNLANGSCQTGQAINDITGGGFISCTTAGAGGNLATHSNVVMGALQFGSNTLVVTCQAGYSLASSGYSAPSYYEGFTYVKPGGATGVSYKAPVSVTANFAFNGTSMVSVSFTPNLFFAGNTWAAVAHCVKVS